MRLPASDLGGSMVTKAALTGPHAPPSRQRRRLPLALPADGAQERRTAGADEWKGPPRLYRVITGERTSPDTGTSRPAHAHAVTGLAGRGQRLEQMTVETRWLSPAPAAQVFAAPGTCQPALCR